MHRRGFTLIEVLIYTALVGIILGSVVLIMQTFLSARAKNQAQLMLIEGMQYALNRMSFRIEHATGVTVPARGVGPTLTLTMPTPSQSPTTFSLSNGTLFLTEVSNAPTALTGTHIEITNLTFQRLTGTTPSIHFHLDGQLRNATGSAQATLNLDHTVTLRK